METRPSVEIGISSFEYAPYIVNSTNPKNGMI
jgi:hypothetical protein